MKMTVEIDCTPQEARALLGLPDLEPLQAAVMAQVEKRVLEAASAMSADGILKTWFSLLPGSETYLKTMAGFLKMSPRPGDPRESDAENSV